VNGLLVWPMLTGLVVALAACLAALGLARRQLPGDSQNAQHVRRGDWVIAGDAWTPSDSWLTNVTALSATIIGAALHVATANGLGALFVIFGLSAAFAPLAYGAFAVKAVSGTVTVGTVFGFLAAAAIVMFGAIGELTTIVLFGTSADYLVSLPMALIFPLIAGIILATYSVRTMIYVLEHMTNSPPKAEDDKGAPLPDRAAIRASYLVAGATRRSATL
jgi:hypothetical protein